MSPPYTREDAGRTDDRDRSMSEILTIQMTRLDWTTARNQLRNMADDWSRRVPDPRMAARCNYLADKIDKVLFDE